MGLFDEISTSEQSAPVKEVAKQFNVPESDVAAAFEKLIPALAGGLMRNSEEESDEDKLLEALKRSNHERYLDKPETLAGQATIDEGNSILGHIFGSKEVSREVASRAAQGTRLDPGLLKQLLPIAATLSMGALKKRANSGGMLENQRSRAAGRTKLSTLLEGDSNRSMIDDLFEKMRRR